jgi:hypothetical protein
MKNFVALSFLMIFMSVYGFSQNGGSCACCYEKARQFDFWIGSWEVTLPDGKPAGTNVIELIQDSCVLRENWTSAKMPYTGTSYNFFNKQTAKWQQVWLDNAGGSLMLEGEFVNGKMILYGKPAKNQKGQLQSERITWTPNTDGSVRQHWESSTDNGKTWLTAFDGLYRKK